MKRSILIAEDHDFLRESLKDYLNAAFPDCTILEASDGAMAVRHVEEDKPDLVVLDLMLPRISGSEVLRRIKKLSPGTRVVVHSLHEEPGYRQQAIAAGADAFVPKSNGPEMLEKAVADLLKEIA
jgi:DNA-binding NarL/FixJ family response regulator